MCVLRFGTLFDPLSRRGPRPLDRPGAWPLSGVRVDADIKGCKKITRNLDPYSTDLKGNKIFVRSAGPRGVQMPRSQRFRWKPSKDWQGFSFGVESCSTWLSSECCSCCRHQRGRPDPLLGIAGASPRRHGMRYVPGPFRTPLLQTNSKLEREPVQGLRWSLPMVTV